MCEKAYFYSYNIDFLLFIITMGINDIYNPVICFNMMVEQHQIIKQNSNRSEIIIQLKIIVQTIILYTNILLNIYLVTLTFYKC